MKLFDKTTQETKAYLNQCKVKTVAVGTVLVHNRDKITVSSIQPGYVGAIGVYAWPTISYVDPSGHTSFAKLHEFEPVTA